MAGITEDKVELILNDLSLYKLYDVLNREAIEDKDIRYCKDMPRNFKGYKDIYELCKMFEKNLRELPKIMSAETDYNEQCRYLIFWLNDQMRKKFNLYMIPTINKNEIMQEFFSLSSMINANLVNKCRYTYNTDIDLELWKNWKDLYDYIRNKNNIAGKIESDMRLCKTYKEYYTHIESIYEKYKEECCGENYGNCPYHLNFKEWCNKEDILTELKCVQPAELSEFPGVDEKVITAKPAAEDNEELPNAVIFNSTGTVIGTSLGIVLPLIMIYRFTPLGSWINTKIFRKNKLMENMIRNERELLINNSGIGEMNFDNSRYHLVYNSAHNE
ncbi:CYIR protein [Plasmodium cynomolgi strain B]|uniref:CYIR protein n=1 Tax=Plasmodium cynomolgi (strain B) TaxID=1120755 RepID=K6V2P5_PLACD|nr:CYIR protein [Plasmodium cynomolgi strain B]GAB69530.1 CYIR protein [Plasmodium cynomolgi strain B]